MGTFQIFDHNKIPKIANSTVNFFLVIVSSVLLYMCAKHIDFVSNTIFRCSDSVVFFVFHFITSSNHGFLLFLFVSLTSSYENSVLVNEIY